MDDQVAAAQQQDNLRPLRMFVNILQAGLGYDQSMAGTDAIAANPPGQFVYVGANGLQSVQGQPVSTATAAFGLPRWAIWAGLGAVAYHFFKKG